jgi:hypothetical protein
MCRAHFLALLLLLLGMSGEAAVRCFGSRISDEAPPIGVTAYTVPAKITPRGDFLKGRLIYKGDPPEATLIKAIELHKDRDCCLKGEEYEKRDQTWIIDKKTKGVANVVIWLEPGPAGSFALKPEDLKVNDAEIDQPHCAFVPHVLTMFPASRNGGRLVSTGQKLIARNSADITHCVKIRGDELRNPQKSVTLPPKSKINFLIAFQKKPLQVGCDFHPWMNALVFTFDHPYHAVTDMKGNFQIDRIPTGIELTVVAWHEAKKEFKREKSVFQPGENNLHWTVSK